MDDFFEAAVLVIGIPAVLLFVVILAVAFA